MSALTLPCACGATATANPLDPTPGVRAHVRMEPHRSWSEATHLEPTGRDVPLRPTVGPLTVERLALLGLLPRRAA